VRRRLLRLALRRGLLWAHDAHVLAEWEHGGGFPVDAKVHIEAHERDGLERLLRYRARPAFALERLRVIDPEPLVYESSKPGTGGSVRLLPTPVQLLDRLAALTPPPRKHRLRYHGALAPNSSLREPATALAQPAVNGGAKANISGDENRKLPWLQARNCRACNHDKVYRPSAASRVCYARLQKTAAWP